MFKNLIELNVETYKLLTKGVFISTIFAETNWQYDFK